MAKLNKSKSCLSMAERICKCQDDKDNPNIENDDGVNRYGFCLNEDCPDSELTNTDLADLCNTDEKGIAKLKVGGLSNKNTVVNLTEDKLNKIYAYCLTSPEDNNHICLAIKQFRQNTISSGELSHKLNALPYKIMAEILNV